MRMNIEQAISRIKTWTIRVTAGSEWDDAKAVVRKNGRELVAFITDQQAEIDRLRERYEKPCEAEVQE